MTRLLQRLRRLITNALGHTRDLWPDIRRAYGWVHHAARILNNEAGLDAAAVARRFAGLIAAIARHRARAGTLAGAVDHFLKVTRSYRPGLFHSYAVAGLPRTNNDLERLFGAHRRHERPAAGPPHPAWCCAARCGSSRRRSPGCAAMRRAISPSPIGANGARFATASSRGADPVSYVAASAATRKPS
jgi:hypothetical protein